MQRFETFEVLPQQRQLRVGGRLVHIGARAFDVLSALIDRHGRVVSREELLDIVWPNMAVEENNLTIQIGSLRRLLGADVVATIPGRGYQLTARPADLSGAEPPSKAGGGMASVPLPTAPPALLPPLIGRTDDLKAVRALLDTERLVTVAGAGGVGKTALAQHLEAALRADRPCWVDLAVIEDAAQLPAAMAAALGLPLGRADALSELVLALSTWQGLLVLDNAEHLVNAVAHLAARLLASAPGLRLLVTSQVPLQVPGERIYRLDGLAVPAHDPPACEALAWGAIALFDERARAGLRNFVLDDGNVALVCTLCRRLDGCALAIELAAARLPLLGLQGLVAALDQRLRLLTAGHRNAPARQQTLRAALEWSHGLLSEAEQAVFRRLAVCAGAVDLGLIACTVGDERLDEWCVLDALGALVDRSLVAMVNSEAPRYRLLESPRALALERLQASGDEAAARQRHARAVAQRWQAAWDTHYDGSIGVDDWVRMMGTQLDDARAAFWWAVRHDATAASAIGPALMLALPHNRALLNPVAAALLDVLPRAQLAAGLRARVLNDAANASDAQIPSERAHSFEQALALFRSEDDQFGQYLNLGQTAVLEVFAGDAAAAAPLIEQMRALEDPDWPPHRLRKGAAAQALYLAKIGDVGRAVVQARRAARLELAAGLQQGSAQVNLVDLEVMAGEPGRAIEVGMRVLASLEGRGFDRLEAMMRANVVLAALETRDTALARELATHARGWASASRQGIASAWGAALALLAAVEGRWRAAACLCGFAHACYRRIDFTPLWLEDRALRQARAAAEAQLGAGVCEQLGAEGADLSDSQVTRIAFAADDLSVA